MYKLIFIDCEIIILVELKFIIITLLSDVFSNQNYE